MVMLAATAVINSVKAALDIGKGMHSLEVNTEVKLAISEMLDKLLDAKRDAHEAFDRETSLLERIGALEIENRRLKEQSADLAEYEPKRFYPGVTAYVLKPALAEGRHPHKLCENCYSNGKKSELAATATRKGAYRQNVCPSCKTEYFIGEEIPPGGPDERPRPNPQIERGESSWVSARRGGRDDWMGS